MSLEMRRTEELVEPVHKRAVGNVAGIVSDWYLSHRSRSDPEAFLTVPNTTDIASLVGASGSLDLGVSGKGQTLSASLTSALGETIERYCLCWPPAASELDTESYSSRKQTHEPVRWEYLDVFTDEQRSSVLDPLTKATPIQWTTGTNLLTGDAVSVPAELVWMRVGSLASVPQHFPGSSNGCAAGTDLTDAIVRAIYEAIERDAFMRMWCRQRPPTQLSIPDTGSVRDVYDRISKRSLTPYLFAYESPVPVPTIGAALCNDRNRRPHFVTGGGAHRSASDAVVDALNEVAQGWPYTNYMATQHELSDLSAADATDNFDQNVLYYSQPENAHEVEFMFAGDREPLTAYYDTTHPTESRPDLHYVLAALSDAGCTPIAFDLTTPDAAQAGIAVARVVIPELVPLTPPAILPRNHPALKDTTVTTKPHPYP